MHRQENTFLLNLALSFMAVLGTDQQFFLL